MTHTFVVDESNQGIRLDIYITGMMPGYSRSMISKLIGAGQVLVNASPSKNKYTLKIEDKVEVNDGTLSTADLPIIDLPIIYEDENVVVIDKPIGVLSHSKGAYNPEATVSSWFATRDKDTKIVHLESDRVGIVHRLDRATSGVMILAKTDETRTFLQKQFSERNLKKTYIAIVEGELDKPEAIIEWPIERNPKKPQTFRVGQNGKSASTKYKVLKVIDLSELGLSQSGKATVVELHPATGRTHQLRVHMEHLGHPIVGDTFYDGLVADRLYLHAHSLEITLPGGVRKTFVSQVPAEFRI